MKRKSWAAPGFLLLLLLAQAGAGWAATYTMAAGSRPPCSSGWAVSGSTYTCPPGGTVTLNSGDTINPASAISIVANAGITLNGNNTIGSASASVNLTTTYGDLTINGGSTIYGNLTASSGDISLTNTALTGSANTNGDVILSGGSISGNVIGRNGVATTNGTNIGGSVTANTGAISLSGGSVAGSVHSECCTITANNTNLGGGASSNSISSAHNTITINGGTVSGDISTSGGGGISISNATMTDGSITTANVPINISNSQIGSPTSPVAVTSNHTITITNNSVVYGSVQGASWQNPATVVSANSVVHGTCTNGSTNSSAAPAAYGNRCDGDITGGGVLHHILIEHGSNGLTCQRETVTFKACANADCDDLFTGGNVAFNLSPTDKWYAAATGGAPLTNPQVIPLSGALTLYLQQSSAATVSVNATLTSGTVPVTCNNGTTAAPCGIVFTDAGLIFTQTLSGDEATILSQTAGVPFPTSYYLRAVKNENGACVASVQGSRNVMLSHVCIDPATCAGNYMTMNGGTAFGSAGTSRSFTFDGNGYSTTAMQFNYFDVGKIKLAATTTSDTGASLTGNSNEFVVKPYALVLSGIKCTTPNADNCGAGALAMATPGDNPGASTAAGPTFIRAGQPFTVTVTAQAEGGSPTPNFGKESVPEWVKLDLTLVGGTVNPVNGVNRKTSGSIASGSNALTVASSIGYAVGDRIRIAGAGTAGTDLVTTVASVPSTTALTLSTTAVTTVSGAEVHYMFPAFSGGTATGGNFTWDEVGIITLTPNLADGNYLGVSFTGTASGNIGRFYPHHFGVTGSVTNRSDLATPGGDFTYMDEPMKLDLIVTAYNKGENPTKNYKDDFAKLDATTLGTTFANWKCTSGTQCMGIGAVSGSDRSVRLAIDTTAANSTNPSNTAWANGVSTFTLYAKFARLGSPDGPYAVLKLGAKPRDEDGVTLPPKSSTDIVHCSDLDIGTGNEDGGCTFDDVDEALLRRKIGETQIRFGRLRLVNFYGSELLVPRVEYRAEYWDGARWTINALDSHTAIAASNIATGGLAVGNVGALANGSGFITFGVAGAGSYDIAANLNASGSDTSCNPAHGGTPARLPWLQGYWSAPANCGGVAAWAQDPNARIRLGSPRAPYIYLRERY